MTVPRDLRAQLVETGMRHWAEQGAAGFSVARIAKQLGVSTASPYRHFADRDGLLVAVVARAAEELTVGLTEAVDDAWPQPVDRLRAAAATWVRRTRDSRIGLAEFVLPEVERADPALRETCRQPVELVSGLVVAAVAGDADQLVRDVLAMLHGYATVPAHALAAAADGGDLAKAAADAVVRLVPPARRPRRDSPDPAPAGADQPSLF